MMAGQILVPFTGTWPSRKRFGITVKKVYNGDLWSREHRANMFREGLPPMTEPGIRTFAKVAVSIGALLLLIGLVGLGAEDDEKAGDVEGTDQTAGALFWVLIGASAVGWGIWQLLHTRDVILPAVNPYEYDKMLETFQMRSSAGAQERLSLDEQEDVRVQAAFSSAAYYPIHEATVAGKGFQLHPSYRVFARVRGQREDGMPVVERERNKAVEFVNTVTALRDEWEASH